MLRLTGQNAMGCAALLRLIMEDVLEAVRPVITLSRPMIAVPLASVC